MQYTYSLVFSFLLVFSGLLAQENVSPKSNFKEGVYLQAKQFFSNNPTQSNSAWMNLVLQSNTDQNIIKILPSTIEAFKNEGIDLQAAWGISLNKTPYIRLIDTLHYDKNDLLFARLYVVGNLCYFYHRTERIEELIMNVYNPLTQQKVGQKPIANRKKIMAQSIFRFGEEKMEAFNEATLSKYLKNDAQVYASWLDLPKPVSQEQLFKLLLIYNERNPVAFWASEEK